MSLGRRSFVGHSLAAALALAGPRARGQGASRTLRLGISTAGVGQPPRVSSGWLAVAQAQRTLERALAPEGVTVEWIFFKGQGPAVNEALGSGLLDFTTLGDLPALISRSVGLPVRPVMVTGRGAQGYLLVRADGPIRQVEALRGKRLGFHKGTATQLSVQRLLGRHGLQERDVRGVNLDPASATAAFLAGDLDAVAGALSLLPLVDTGHARLLASSHDDPRHASTGVLLVTERHAAEQPERTQRVVDALVEVAHAASQPAQREAVLKLWASAGSLRPAHFEQDLRGAALAERFSPRFDAYARAQLQRAAEEAQRNRLIRKPVDVPAWIDPRWVEQAVQRQGLEHAWPAQDAQGQKLRG